MAVDEAAILEADRKELHGMGYAQELRRGLGTFSNFAISFSIISVLAGALTTYYLPLLAGGPRAINASWIIIGAFALLVGMAMAEICSSMPTAGGLYYWSAKLAKNPKSGAQWSWFTGWFNLLGQIGVIASVDYALSVFVAYFVSLYATSWFGLSMFDYKSIFIIYTLILISHGLLNTFGVGLVKRLMDISVWWHVIGVAVIVVALFAIPDRGKTIGFGAWFDFHNNVGWTGFSGSGIYVFIIGLLIAQYTITGFDASAHVSEETREARVGAPKAIVRSIYISVIAAWILTFAVTTAIPKGTFEQGAGNLLGKGLIPAPLEVFQKSIGGNMAKVIILIAIVGQFFCGMASVTANSRMTYAFSRDGALPGSKYWHRINPKTRTPTNSVWLGVTLAFLLGFLTFLQSANYAVAFFAFVGITAVGLYIAYVIPVFLRLRSTTFKPGPWNLGRWSKAVGWTAVSYVVFVNLMFLAPQFGPVHVFWPPWGGDFLSAPKTFTPKVNNFNFTGPIIIVFAVSVWLYWQLSAKNWFKGPRVMGSEDELRKLEDELAAVERGEAPAEEFYKLEDKLESGKRQ